MGTKFAIAVLVAILGLQPMSVSQLPRSVSQLPTPGRSQQTPNPDIPARAQKEMEKKANEQRHAELKRDTEKLLQLSNELKEYVDKSDENVLSVDVVRKAEEIEKLAHSVKTKMRGN